MKRSTKEIDSLLVRMEDGKKLVIIGEGKIGKILADLLIQKSEALQDQIIFLVDDGYKKHDEYQQLPIYEITEFNKFYNDGDFIFVNTVTSVETNLYKERLREQGITDVSDFNSSEIAIAMLSEYWINYLKKREIDVEGEILRIGDFRFPNPFLASVAKDIQYPFLVDIRDLILPCWLEDYSKCEDGPYESENVKICEGDIVLDCGANIGISTANAIARNCKKVYSIEPVRNDSLDKCKRMFGDRMSLHHVALSDYEGTAEIHINPEANNDNSIYYVQNTLVKSQTVEVTTIDSFCEQNVDHVDFIKVYVDDLEGRMLQGARNTISKYLPKLVVFASLPYDITELKKKLESIIKSIDDRYVIEYSYSKIFAYVKK